MKYLNTREQLFKIVFHLLIIATIFTAAGCSALSVKTQNPVPVFLSPLNEADKSKLIAEVNRFAEIKTIRGKVDVKFEDNSFAESGLVEKYKTADGVVIVQSPGNINLKIQIPVVGTDIVQMTSDGEKFRVAVLCCVEEKYKKFVFGTNANDYSASVSRARTVLAKGGEQDRAVSVFASLRPQHFTDALLMRRIEPENGEYIYTQSEIYQDEADLTNKKSRIQRVIRGYYLLDELRKNSDGEFKISRRFWFNRVGGITLARQQVFDQKGVLETDIAYGREEKFTETAGYSMPIQVQVTRPQERYSVRITYQQPNTVVIDKPYDAPVFLLENKWQLPEVDLDKQNQTTLANQPNQ